MPYDAGGDYKPVRPTGLLASLQRLLGTAVEILHTRAEILSAELEEEGGRVRQLLLYDLAAFFFLGLSLLLITLFVVVLFWDTHRLLVLGAFAVLYLAIGAGTAVLARRKLKTRPRLFSATLSELHKDLEVLGSRP